MFTRIQKMNKPPKVSVLMITYNHEKYIKQAIESVLMQETDFPFELVISEDCSTDRTATFVRDYAKKHPHIIRVLLNPENLGSQQNSRQAFKAARGNYVALLEGDDFWIDPLKLKKQVDFMDEHPDFGVVHTDINLLYDRENKIIRDYHKTEGMRFPTGYVFTDLLTPPAFFIKTSTVLMKNHMIDFDRFYDLLRQKGWVLGDLALWLTIARHHKIAYLPETTSTYRLIEESESRTRDPRKNHQFHQSIFGIRYHFWEESSKDPVIKEKLDREYHLVLLGDAFKMGDKMLAEKAYRYFKENKINLPIKQKIKHRAMQDAFCCWITCRIRKIIGWIKK